MKQRLNTAIVLAAMKHDGQYDKSGEPYILHLMKVMHYVKTKDEDLQIIAILHDIVEDTDVEIEYVRLVFGNRVADAVELLSKIRPNETQEQYLAGILTNVDAMLVKRADLRHNMDVRRMKGLREKDFARMQKYAHMFTVIEEKLSELGIICL